VLRQFYSLIVLCGYGKHWASEEFLYTVQYDAQLRAKQPEILENLSLEKILSCACLLNSNVDYLSKERLIYFV
jgi:hypothetical protein